VVAVALVTTTLPTLLLNQLVGLEAAVVVLVLLVHPTFFKQQEGHLELAVVAVAVASIGLGQAMHTILLQMVDLE
jgi:hypothetical protein